MKSQNAIFKGEIPSDSEFDHPSGAWLARRLCTALTATGWQTSEFDNWRDCGWSIPCARNNVRLEIVFSPWGENEWLLQVAPLDCPGFLRRLLGARQSAMSSDVTTLARAIHGILSSYSQVVSGLRWQADGPPDEVHSTPEPTE